MALLQGWHPDDRKRVALELSAPVLLGLPDVRAQQGT